MVAINFTPDTSATYTNSKYLGEGTYNVTIVAAVQDSIAKDPGGSLLRIEMADDASGQIYNHRLNLWHTNVDTQGRAARDFSALCNVLSMNHVSDTDELIGKKLVIDVVPQRNNPQFMELREMRPAPSPSEAAAVQPVTPSPVATAAPVAGQAAAAASWQAPFNRS